MSIKRFSLYIQRDDAVPSTIEELDALLCECKSILYMCCDCYEDVMYYDKIIGGRIPDNPRSIPLIRLLTRWNGFQNLTSLSLPCGINPESAKYLADALPRAKNLIELDLSFNDVIKEGIRSIISSLPRCNVKKLNLDGLRLKPEHISALAKILPISKIQWLELYNNDIGLQGATDLSNAISLSTCPLRTLLLRNTCNGEESDIIMDSLKLPTCRLRHLNMYKCARGSLYKELMPKILENNRHLQYFTIGFREESEIFYNEFEINRNVREFAKKSIYTFIMCLKAMDAVEDVINLLAFSLFDTITDDSWYQGYSRKIYGDSKLEIEEFENIDSD